MVMEELDLDQEYTYRMRKFTRYENTLICLFFLLQLIIIGMLTVVFYIGSQIDMKQINNGLELLQKSEYLFTFIHKIDSCVNRLHICKMFD